MRRIVCNPNILGGKPIVRGTRISVQFLLELLSAGMSIMHASRSHPYLQIVDYLSWAVYVKWTRAERRPWNNIAHLIRTEHEVFEDSERRYY